MKKKSVAFLFIIFVLTNQLVAQKTEEIKIKEIAGEAMGGEELSNEKIKQKAINDAKIKAIQKAGIEEDFSSVTAYFKCETDSEFEELYTSNVLSNIAGAVKDVELISSSVSHPFEGQTKYMVTIYCTVVKYNVTKDLTFDTWVEGIMPFYKAGSGFSFSLKPTQPCYIRAFMFTDDSYVLLPNDWEKSKLLPAHEVTTFPNKDLIESYELTIGNKEKETNQLIIVLLKKDIYYTGKMDYKEITDWIMSIPPDERLIKSFAFQVYK
jgi:hypothetical protein